jgi:arsenate reductase
MIKIYHNPRCSKSREALALLEKSKCEYEVIEYLKTKPSRKELKDVLAKLGLNAIDIIRTKEEVFQKKYKDKKFTNEEWISILLEHPVLMERPIVVRGYKAVIGRPVENVTDLLG